MSEHFPDLEIYVLKGDADVLLAWLNADLGSMTVVSSKGDRQHWQWPNAQGVMDVYFNANAEKNLASLWFKQNHTPWATDLDCARAAHAALGTEIRCSLGGWQEGDDATAQAAASWMKLIHGLEKPFVWDK